MSKSYIRIFIISAVIGLGLITSRFSIVQAAPALTISPTVANLVSDEPQTYIATLHQDDGTTQNVSASSVLSTDDPFSTITGMTYTPGKVGAWNVQASYQGLIATAAVNVSPGTVKEIVVNPNSGPELTTIGQPVKFIGTAYDTHNNIISGQDLIWSVIGEIGTIDASGKFTPKKIGTVKIQAMAQDVTGLVTVVVRSAPPVVTNVNTSATNTNVGQSNANVSKTNQRNANQAITGSLTGPAKTKCTTIKPWLWSLILVVFLLAVAILYGLVPVTKIWTVITVLVVAAVLAYIQRQYGCGAQSWWAWVVTLGALAITALALQRRAPPPPPPPIQTKS